MTSPFASAGPRLRDNGVSTIPLMAGDKMPGTCASGAWRPESKWQRFCERLPTAMEMDIWGRWPDAGVCAALGFASGPAGMQLVAIDEDVEDADIVAAIRAVVPPSPVRKKGRKGETGFYLASAEIKSRPYSDAAKRRMVDLLCTGRQTVLPPSIHPDTRQPYRWLTLDTLESFDLADLPVLPDDIADRLGEALAPWGYVPPELHATSGSATLDPSESPHRALNEASLANLDAWVPALQLHGCTRSGGHYRAVAHWRASASGRPLAKRSANLSIAPEGIKDFGDSDKGYTPLDLVMAACGADLDTAFGWLQDRVAPSRPILLNVTNPDPPPVASAEVAPLRRGNLMGLVTGEPPLRDLGENVIELLPRTPTQDVWAGESSGGVLLAGQCTPDGLVGKVVEWMNASAAKPLPHLNLGATIAMLGAVMGRRWESPTRARTNFYIMGIAVSGAGKDHPQNAARSLMLAAGMDKLMAAEETKSDSAIRKMLERWPVAFMIMDEFGGFMRKVLDRRAAAHDKRMRDLLLTFFSRANGDYMGSEGATERAVMIRNPHLCIFGCSTPDDIWAAFDSASGNDGLLARFLVLDTGDARPKRVRPTADVTSPPEELVRAIRGLMDIRPDGNLNGLGNQPVKPIRAEWGPGAEEWFEDYEEASAKMGHKAGAKGTVYARAAEHVLKLALVKSVGCDPKYPVITVSSLDWAHDVVETSMTALFRAMEDRVADTDKQREYQWVLRTIRDGGQYGVPAVSLKKAVGGRFDKRRFDDIVGQLTDAGEIWSANISGPAGGRPCMRYLAKAAEADVA